MDPVSALSKFADRAQKVAQRAGMYKGPLWGVIVCLIAAGVLVPVGAPTWLIAVPALLTLGFYGLCVASFVYATRRDKPELLLSEGTHQTIEIQRMLMGQKDRELDQGAAPKPIADDRRLRELLAAEPAAHEAPRRAYLDAECHAEATPPSVVSSVAAEPRTVQEPA